MTIPAVVVVSREGVVSSSNGAGHHTAGVELELGLKGSYFIFLVEKTDIVQFPRSKKTSNNINAKNIGSHW